MDDTARNTFVYVLLAAMLLCVIAALVGLVSPRTVRMKSRPGAFFLYLFLGFLCMMGIGFVAPPVVPGDGAVADPVSTVVAPALAGADSGPVGARARGAGHGAAERLGEHPGELVAQAVGRADAGGAASSGHRGGAAAARARRPGGALRGEDDLRAAGDRLGALRQRAERRRALKPTEDAAGATHGRHALATGELSPRHLTIRRFS
jgi:hypothetical protein